MKPVILLNKLGLLNGGFMLDVGARDCSNSVDFVDKGFSVDAIDIEEASDLCKDIVQINYRKTSFEDFNPDKKYDVIVARHVIPFLSISIESSLVKLHEMLSEKGVLFFTVFGEDDEWCGETNLNITNLNSVREMVKDLGEIVYESEERFSGNTYAGDNKKWHIITMVLVKG